MQKLNMLATGENLSDIKAAAKNLAAQGVTTKAAALAEAAAKHGVASWTELKSRGWSLDEDGDIGAAAACEMPGSNVKIQAYSALIDLDDDYIDLDETWSVNVSLSTRYTPYLYVSFVSAYEGSNFDLSPEQKAAFEKAIETGSKADAIVAQAALIEDVMRWFEKYWLEATTADICNLQRLELGIKDEDLFWCRPDIGDDGKGEQSLKVYDAGDGEMLVCIEGSNLIEEEEDPYGYITYKEYNDVPDTPDDYAKMEEAFLVAAGIQVPFAGSRSHMDQPW